MTDHDNPKHVSGPTAARGAPVRLERLSKRYDDVIAVDDISLDIHAGEFVTLLGPSGSGKTTTLMMLAGFQEVTDGTITVGDREISRLPPNKRDIGVVFQHYALFPHMRVDENVGFPLKMRGVGKAEGKQRVAEALQLVKLKEYGRRYPRQLSGGQQQRVALARAVVFEPGLALMDEPLGALDRQLREQMQFEIKRMQETLGITVIYVTHDQEEALVMSDRIAVMTKGKIEQFASPSVLYNEPATAFVATFVGESNLLNGTAVDARGDSMTVRTAGGLELVGRVTSTIADGDAIVATVRPEKLLVLEAGEPHGETENQIQVVCSEVTYAGQMSRYVVTALGGDAFVLRVQNRPGSVTFSVGQALLLMFGIDDLRVFPAEQLPGPPQAERPE